MSLSELYFLFIFLPGLGVVAIILAIILGVGYGLVLLVLVMVDDLHDSDRFSKAIKAKTKVIIVVIIFSIIGGITPSQKDMFLLVGGYAATNSKELAKLPDNVLKAANNYLDKIANQKEEKK